MKAWLAAGGALAITLAAPRADAAPARVVVAGPEGDAVATRLDKELVALGFETVRLPLQSCTRDALATETSRSSAAAAACVGHAGGGAEVGVWGALGSTLRLREIVRPETRSGDEKEEEIAAVRAAEVVRVSVSDAQEDAEKSARPPVVITTDSGWSAFEPAPDKPRPEPPPRVTPRFTASAGVSALAGVDATVAAAAAQISVGLTRRLAATARLDYPLTADDHDQPAALLRVRPAFAGVGAELPLAEPSAFLIPRLGAGVGVVWVDADLSPAADASPLAQFTARSAEASAAAYASAGLSMRIVGPLRGLVDGTLGTSASRIVVRDRGEHAAYWGQPFGTIGGRVELVFR